ncbi:hypothetical protein [Facilibium subflavum]|uniref:hypothetical protein n=1 Tax=Facilibium subflavum TaxID=2219058 RepID=UPI000E649590|nr:hypothetical protein [Facilibium subflavum]
MNIINQPIAEGAVENEFLNWDNLTNKSEATMISHIESMSYTDFIAFINQTNVRNRSIKGTLPL